jgi:hypothetical protein
MEFSWILVIFYKKQNRKGAMTMKAKTWLAEHQKDRKKLIAFIAVVTGALLAIPVIFEGCHHGHHGKDEESEEA